jgi:hypothetical protein
LEIDGRHLTAWGAHIGVRSTELVISDLAGRVIRHERLDWDVRMVSPEETLNHIADKLSTLGVGLPEPVNIGVAFSAHVENNGLINSASYGWSNVDVSALLPFSASVGTGVSAMAGTEIIETPLQSNTHPSTLYFYAREVIAHAWIFNGTVHRPNSGRTPAAFSGPLSNSATLEQAYRRGLHAGSLSDLVRLSQSNAIARDVLDTRARGLGRAVTAAVDIVDPDAVVFAGEAFTADPQGLRIVVDTLRSATEHRGQLRIQRADTYILRTAAVQVALHPVRQDPLAYA